MTRLEMYKFIKEHELEFEIKSTYGRNFTNVSNADLQDYINEYSQVLTEALNSKTTRCCCNCGTKKGAKNTKNSNTELTTNEGETAKIKFTHNGNTIIDESFDGPSSIDEFFDNPIMWTIKSISHMQAKNGIDPEHAENAIKAMVAFDKCLKSLCK